VTAEGPREPDNGPPDADALAARRARRLWLIGATFVVAAVLVGIVIALGGDDDGSGTITGKPEGTAETLELYKGIPQRGTELGNPDAKVTLTEFADLQCPFCGVYGREVFPEVVTKFVRTGKVKVQLRLLKFIGDDSVEAARMAHAAGQQNKLFQFVDLVYRNQGIEETGWVDDAYLKRIGEAIGLDVDRALAARDSAAVTAELDKAIAEGKAAKVESTPWFLLTKAGAKPERFEADTSNAAAFADALDKAIAGQ
jgi:protein-disulfide isomerase